MNRSWSAGVRHDGDMSESTGRVTDEPREEFPGDIVLMSPDVYDELLATLETPDHSVELEALDMLPRRIG